MRSVTTRCVRWSVRCSPVGEGRRPVGWPEDVLNSRYRNSLVNVAPAHGLTLMAVDYPPDDQLQARAELTRQRRA